MNATRPTGDPWDALAEAMAMGVSLCLTFGSVLAPVIFVLVQHRIL